MPKEDAPAIQKALTKLVDNSELRKRLANNISSVVREKFSLKKMVEETLNLYK